MSVSVFRNWKRSILRQRGLQAPDGRSLYLYRLTDAEFSELETLLKDKLKQYLTHTNLGTISSNIIAFPALFVFYAAEWWRRRYDGSGWSWEPILHDLGADPAGWSLAQRSYCVKYGLREWALKLRETGGFRYLGAIALQGGLPMRLLAEAHGQLGRILGQVLRQAQSGSVGLRDITSWLESMHGYLPKTYRQSEIYVLLAEVVWTVLCLKEEAKLVQSTEAVAQLDKTVPDWRERFPMPVTDAHAQGLLEHLIRDATSVRTVQRALPLPVERLLEQTGKGVWSLISSIELPEKLTATELNKLFSHDGPAPRTLELSLDLGGERRSVTLRRLLGHDAYRVERLPWRQEGEQAADQHILRLLAPSGQSWTARPSKGEALDPDLPWAFGLEQERFRLLRQGSGSVVALEALVAIGEGWSVSAANDSIAEFQGELELPARRVYRIRGTVRIDDPAGQSYRLRTGWVEATEEHYEWLGENVWEVFLSPKLAFRNIPKLHVVDEAGNRQPVSGQMEWRLLGGNPTAPGQSIGPLSVSYRANGELKHRTRMVILPPNATLEIEPTSNDAGFIRLLGWQAQGAAVVTPGVDAVSTVQGRDLLMSLLTQGQATPPEWVELELRWLRAPTPAKVRFPFPSKGARVFDGHGRILAAGALIAAHQLAGVRLLALGGTPDNMPPIQLVLGLNAEQRPRIFSLHPPAGSVRVEIRLQDYVADIQHLLAVDDSPDACVAIDLHIGNEAFNCLRVARYTCNLWRQEDHIGLNLEGLSKLESETVAALPVLAMRLDNPGEEAVRLEAAFSQDVPTGMWHFAPAMREPGAWLIYPGADSELAFRPTLWTIRGNVSSDSPLLKALGIAENATREAELDAVIEVLAANFTDSCWEDVERLAGQIGHLQLAVMDLWRRFARSAAGMAALALRLSGLPNGFIQRFAQELPFAWETVSCAVWRQAMRNLQCQCITWYGETHGPALFTSQLQDRCDELVAQQPVLHNLLGITQAEVTGEKPKEIGLFHNLGVDGIGDLLFEVSDCPLQQLLRTHAENAIRSDQWPTGFRDWISDYRQRHRRLFHATGFDFQDSVINLPILVALQAATGTANEWFNNPQRIHALRLHQNFDTDWFVHAYNWTIARCLAAGLLIEEQKS